MTTRSALPPEAIESAFIDACLLDVTSVKPGNVGLHGAGHGMQVAQFIRSARAAAPEIARPGATVGERIARAISATHDAVGINTNLGIVLLAAPLAQAALLPGKSLAEVLGELTIEDAEHAFAAIRLANPGGLGRSPRHDVHAPARVTLLEAMGEAAPRDRIALQYRDGFVDVLGTGRAAVTAARARDLDWCRTASAVFLAFLARYTDSHVERKLGDLQARTLRETAAASEAAAPQCAREHDVELERWDRDLKSRGVNPGTSADLTVATLFASFLEIESGWSAGSG